MDRPEKSPERRREDLIEPSFREALDAMFEGVQLLDSAWRYVYLNETPAGASISHMTRRAEELLEEALALDPSDRADLAATLLESLDEASDDAIEEAWAREVERRVAEVESGAVRTIPWSEARQELLKRLGDGS